ncbi:MAG TPA: hypothetical protein VEU28_02835, partial [Actinomycetota bacterium]|nr:hypothetical protein [Actinomycetota bacterium]
MARKLLFGLVGVIVLTIAGSLYLFRDVPVPSEPDGGTGASPSIASELPELSAFVEEARGLEFKTEVKLAVLS